MKNNYRKSNKKYGENLIWILILITIIIIKKSNISIKSFNIPFNYIFGISIVLLLIILLKNLIPHIKIYVKNRKNKNRYLNSGITTVDSMKGTEFESFLMAHFKKLGYNVKLTNASNDYGADLLLRKRREIIVVQAKRYNSKKVGIKAIQELVGSLKYYKATKGIVVTNNYFTSNAINLAEVNNIELWDRKKLIKIMKNNGLTNVANETIKRTNELKLCPECKGKLNIKKGPYGYFYACTNYPKCKFTRKIK